MKAQIIAWRSAVCSLRSAVFRLPSAVRGFTLVELLVAMGILMVIVLMMANLFRQTSIAWESGTRQTEAGLEARAVIGMIQQELNQAVGGSNRNFTASGGTLRFWTLGPLSATNREAREVRYTRAGSRLRKNGVDLLDNVADFAVAPVFAAGAATNTPPLWVDIYLEVGVQSDMSQVNVSSRGNPGWDADDYRLRALRTWR